ncbi:hydrogenase 4 membrane subunit [Dongshaea marina]|uniref:hydrogenase 4 membrane subunit n=1 Tax=Dongshaea marina TaxID=2047966 RepID=UPI000D3E5DFE|nr:hydrogenase 4 membrane subunit [Dongshaea marina]
MDLLINNLAGLLIVTSFFVIVARKAKTAACLYSLQSLVLIGVFCAIAYRYGAESLYEWSITAFITKVVVLPAILYWQFGKMQDPAAEKPLLPVAVIALITAVIVVVCLHAVQAVKLPMVADLKPVLAVSLGHFFMGLLCIVCQRNILKQVFGYCLMENGSSLMLGLLAHKAPHLMEIGITVDAIFAVIVMIILARLIFSKLNTLDVKQLKMLKG